MQMELKHNSITSYLCSLIYVKRTDELVRVDAKFSYKASIIYKK